ncbi:uncharacterized protein DEA37_0009694, partial [Paragonimus westermani]
MGYAASVTIDEKVIVGYMTDTVDSAVLALRMAAEYNLPGAENLFIRRFDGWFHAGWCNEADNVAAVFPK